MSIVIGVGQNRMEIQSGKIEIINLKQYRILQEGNKTPITGYDDSPKNLKLIVSDGIVDIVIQTVGGKQTFDESAILAKFVPEGYKLIDQKEAAKMIKGVKGKYYYYYNKNENSYLALVTRGFGKPGRISLGSLEDRSSTLYQVLEKLPSGTFHKAELNSILPAKIVENRQPIKAALDILERESFVLKTGKKVGVSEEYKRTEKPLPLVGLDVFTSKQKGK